jgi:hypothetical protein
MKTSELMNAWREAKQGGHDLSITFRAGSTTPPELAAWLDKGHFRVTNAEAVQLAKASEGGEFKSDTTIRFTDINRDVFRIVKFCIALRYIDSTVEAVAIN